LLQPDGEYIRAPKTGAPFSVQDYLMGVTEGNAEPVPTLVR